MHSTILQAKLSRCAGAERPVRINILFVNEADVDAFEDVMWAIYHGKLPREDMTVRRALLIAQQADAYAVHTVLFFATRWLNQQQHFSWDEAVRIFRAPPSIRERLQLGRATDALLRRLGDLEAAMNDEHLRDRLASLPEAALAALLSDDRLAVADESSVVAAILLWTNDQALATAPDAVAACVRLTHLDPGYLAAVTAFFPQWTPQVLALLWKCAVRPQAWQALCEQDGSPPVLRATSRQRRARSLTAAAELQVRVSLRELEQAYRGAARDGRATAVRGVEADGTGRALLLHASVLIMHSTVLQARLTRWTGTERPVRINIELGDEAQEAAFEDVIWAMYHNKLPAEMTVQRALRIAQLADAYAMENVLFFGIQWLSQQQELSWDDAARMFDAPLSTQERLQMGKAFEAILQRAGDLEVAMNDEQVRNQLASLPEAALAALLSDSRLAVADESSVVAVALFWAKCQKLATVPDAVAGSIRLAHLDPGYLAAVTEFFPQWTPHVLALLWKCMLQPQAWQTLCK
ncbi:hypothetical protein JKP88DRAFT_289051 [Tribonema minus]|uniref:BACK domain-containing protein n=1 Tax=Tribonema minus TaxID=303371 RepID=A0A835Z2E5_9STRA|nr:hypothetical protein JKP88DRAFT_289051 [Tribonema minus]